MFVCFLGYLDDDLLHSCSEAVGSQIFDLQIDFSHFEDNALSLYLKFENMALTDTCLFRFFPFNRKFICKLPDKGKKILDSVAKVKAAIAECEVRGKSGLFHPVSLDCKLRQKAVAVVDVDTETAQSSDRILDTSSLVCGSSSVSNTGSSKTTSQQRGLVHPPHEGNEEAPEVESTVSACPASRSRASAPSSCAAGERLLQHRVSSQAEDNLSSSDSLFINRLQRITIVDSGEEHSEENRSAENLARFDSGAQKKPHFMEVLETRAKNPVPPLHKFKTNV